MMKTSIMNTYLIMVHTRVIAVIVLGYYVHI
jgi:hypothetical protein